MASWEERRVTKQHLLPYVDSADAAEDVKKALHTLPFERNVFKLLANAPNYMPAFMNLLSRGFAPSKALSPSEWQMTILSTSVALDCPYEWDVNAPFAHLLPGWTPDKFAAIRRHHFSTDGLFTDREALIGKTVVEVAHSNRASMETMNKLKQRFTAEEITEILMVHGIYALLARFMNSCRIDYDEPIPGLQDMLARTFSADIERQRNLTAQGGAR